MVTRNAQLEAYDAIREQTEALREYLLDACATRRMLAEVRRGREREIVAMSRRQLRQSWDLLGKTERMVRRSD